MPTSATSTRWVIDPAHTLVEFSVKHMMIATVKGRFSGIEGTVVGNLPDLVGAAIAVSADAATVDTGEPQRDAHLRSADFFEVEKFPKLAFQSTAVERTGDDQYAITGDLTIHGVTRPVTFAATFEGQGKDPWGNERIGFSAEAKINRKEFGLHWNAALETGGVLVSEQVRIAIQVEAVRQG